MPLTMKLGEEGHDLAVTQGHGNPKWTREETILALDVYFATRGSNPGPKAPELVALSEMLRAMPYHEEAARKPTFRNPDGAAFKVQNLRSLETGKGLQNVSAMDRRIWEEFGTRPAEVARLAGLIKAGLAGEVSSSGPTADNADELEFYEGRLLTRRHLVRERNPVLRRRLLVERLTAGLRCEICGECHDRLPQELRDAAFEAHHITPIAIAGEGAIKLKDLALLCATCHRLIHRTIALKRRWISIDEAHGLLGFVQRA